MFNFALGEIKIRHVATEKIGNGFFLPKLWTLVTFRGRGTVDQRRLRPRELVEFFNLQQRVKKLQVSHRLKNSTSSLRSNPCWSAVPRTRKVSRVQSFGKKRTPFPIFSAATWRLFIYLSANLNMRPRAAYLQPMHLSVDPIFSPKSGLNFGLILVNNNCDFLEKNVLPLYRNSYYIRANFENGRPGRGMPPCPVWPVWGGGASALWRRVVGYSIKPAVSSSTYCLYFTPSSILKRRWTLALRYHFFLPAPKCLS